MDNKRKASGILGSLKKLIFEEDKSQEAQSSSVAQQPPMPEKKQEPIAPTPSVSQRPVVTTVYSESKQSDVKEMKLKVLELLEKLNEQGIDFFEVWNAAAAMGTVDANTVKAAFTSLQFVDKSLSKDKLLSSGKSYASRIKDVIEQDVAQKQRQKDAMTANLANEKQSLQKQVTELEAKINELQAQLVDKQKSLGEIDGRYDGQLKDMDNKIAVGHQAVDEVVVDINNALSIIEKNIN